MHHANPSLIVAVILACVQNEQHDTATTQDTTITVATATRVLTWLALFEDDLASLQGVVTHAACQVKQLAIAQAEEDGHLAQCLKAPHILNWAQQAVKGLALQREAHQCCPCCHSRSPAVIVCMSGQQPQCRLALTVAQSALISLDKRVLISES